MLLFSLHAFHFHVVLCFCLNGDRNWCCNWCYAEPLGGCFTRWTNQFYLPDPGSLVEPFEAVGADPGQRGGACRPVGPQANHQPWSGLRNTDPLHHQSHRGKKTKTLLLGHVHLFLNHNVLWYHLFKSRRDSGTTHTDATASHTHRGEKQSHVHSQV